MPEIEIGPEQEEASRWTYAVRVFDAGRTHDFDVSLSFADYDHWSHGRVAPSRVVEAAFAFLLEREPPASILAKFDCSVIRRYFPEVDRELPTMF